MSRTRGAIDPDVVDEVLFESMRLRLFNLLPENIRLAEYATFRDFVQDECRTYFKRKLEMYQIKEPK